MGRTIPGGLYYVNGVAVDANGVEIPNAPAIGPDTVHAPAGATAPVASIADQIADGVARALALATARAPEATAPPLEPSGKGK